MKTKLTPVALLAATLTTAAPAIAAGSPHPHRPGKGRRRIQRWRYFMAAQLKVRDGRNATHPRYAGRAKSKWYGI